MAQSDRTDFRLMTFQTGSNRKYTSSQLQRRTDEQNYKLLTQSQFVLDRLFIIQSWRLENLVSFGFFRYMPQQLDWTILDDSMMVNLSVQPFITGTFTGWKKLQYPLPPDIALERALRISGKVGGEPNSARRPGVRERIKFGSLHVGIPATFSEGRLKINRTETVGKIFNTFELGRIGFLDLDFHFSSAIFDL